MFSGYSLHAPIRTICPQRPAVGSVCTPFPQTTGQRDEGADGMGGLAAARARTDGYRHHAWKQPLMISTPAYEHRRSVRCRGALKPASGYLLASLRIRAASSRSLSGTNILHFSLSAEMKPPHHKIAIRSRY